MPANAYYLAILKKHFLGGKAFAQLRARFHSTIDEDGIKLDAARRKGLSHSAFRGNGRACKRKRAIIKMVGQNGRAIRGFQRVQQAPALQARGAGLMDIMV